MIAIPTVSNHARRLCALAATLVALVLTVGCDSTNPATTTPTSSTTLVGFASVPVATPGNPTLAGTYTLSFSLSNSTTVSGGVGETIPYAVSVDGAVVTTSVTAAIPANGTLVVTTTPITAGAPGQYQVTVTLDPNDSTGLVSSGGGTQTILITVLPIVGVI